MVLKRLAEARSALDGMPRPPGRGQGGCHVQAAPHRPQDAGKQRPYYGTGHCLESKGIVDALKGRAYYGRGIVVRMGVRAR